MIKYFQTTTIILIWCVVISLMLSIVFYYITSKKNNTDKKFIDSGNILPALILGPLTLVFSFIIFKKNLLFPVGFFASTTDLIKASFIPACILVLSSGMFNYLKQFIHNEYILWHSKTFVLASRAFGKPASLSLKKIVLIRAISSAWTASLPWLFGELIIVENIFAAPGLANEAWHLARIRDLWGLTETVLWLILIYGFFVFIGSMINYWIGKKLESYA